MSSRGQELVANNNLAAVSVLVKTYQEQTLEKSPWMFWHSILTVAAVLKNLSWFIILTMAGLPKAAVVTHERVWAASFIQAACGITADDIFYINLPLYHSAGFLIGMAGAIERGNDLLNPWTTKALTHLVLGYFRGVRVFLHSKAVLYDAGMTIFLRRKFSASQFWDDCRKYDVTVMQYIGETMRYLCNSPKVRRILRVKSISYRPGPFF